MKNLPVSIISMWYAKHFEKNLYGRHIVFDDIKPLIKRLPNFFKKEIIGYSENNIPIYKISIGEGSKKIFCWSQMHGNESTGTKVLFDLFNFLSTKDRELIEISKRILLFCKLEFIVMLNPDGADKFTRENANGIDLNRDAVVKKAIESQILRENLEVLNPMFCFNLHDQRSIFSVSGTSNPATMSFLAPSENKDRKITDGRINAMSVIVAMNNILQQTIPNQVGRFTDEFYPTATGDNFQKLGYPTILIEAGHYKGDYEREITRKHHFIALLQGIYHIAISDNFKDYKSYFDIPNNDKKYLDIIYKNVLDENQQRVDVGVQIKFKLEYNVLVSYKCKEQTGDLSNFHADKTINGEYLTIKELKLSNS